MRACRKTRAVVFSALAFVLACTSVLAQSGPSGLILQADEGERRARRTGDFPFILKVDKKNGGSADMVMGMENLKNPGPATLTIVFLFPKPGFEEYLRDTSAPEGQSMPPMSPEARAQIRAKHEWHTIYDQR